MKTTVKKARFLHQDSREYRGHRRARKLKTLANRIERRTVRWCMRYVTFMASP